jgi:hypothetical protein
VVAPARGAVAPYSVPDRTLPVARTIRIVLFLKKKKQKDFYSLLYSSALTHYGAPK